MEKYANVTWIPGR